MKRRFGNPQGMLRRALPRSLFGQLVLVLAGGLLVAQLLSAAINLAERDRLLSSNFGMQPAQRIADVVRLLDNLPEAERAQVVAVFGVPPLVLSLQAAPGRPEGDAGNWQARMFGDRLRQALGEDRALRVEGREGFALPPPGSAGGMRGGMGPGGMRGGGPGMMGRGPMAGQGLAAALPIVRTEVQFIQSYFDLLKTRHGDALFLQMDIDKRYDDYLLPILETDPDNAHEFVTVETLLAITPQGELYLHQLLPLNRKTADRMEKISKRVGDGYEQFAAFPDKRKL